VTAERDHVLLIGFDTTGASSASRANPARAASSDVSDPSTATSTGFSGMP